MGFTREELLEYRDASVPDLLGDEVRLLLVGINPGLWTAATQTHFAHPGNRFCPALYLAGITAYPIDAGAGYSERDVAELTGRGIAITNLVNRATAKASELARDELRRGAQALKRKVAHWEPQVVAVAGITAYREAFGQRKARAGRQPESDWIGGIETWVVPNPSGLNAHETVDSLARAYRETAEAAGIPLDPPRW